MLSYSNLRRLSIVSVLLLGWAFSPIALAQKGYNLCDSGDGRFVAKKPSSMRHCDTYITEPVGIATRGNPMNCVDYAAAHLGHRFDVCKYIAHGYLFHKADLRSLATYLKNGNSKKVKWWKRKWSMN